MKPLIGLNLDVRSGATEQLFLNTAYCQAIQAAGGIPLLIAPMSDEDLREILPVLAGMVFTGGKDYLPALYGGSTHASIDPAHALRQDFDIRLMRKCLHKENLPILGICAGHQLLNIALGGTLIPDLDSQSPSAVGVKHLGPDATSTISEHAVEVVAGSLLADIFRTKRIAVPSSHHQAVGALGAGLRVSSRAEDGVVESIELPGRSLTLGVQWHPERDYMGHSHLFQQLVSVGAGY